jgi:hypothetical protein
MLSISSKQEMSEPHHLTAPAHRQLEIGALEPHDMMRLRNADCCNADYHNADYRNANYCNADKRNADLQCCGSGMFIPDLGSCMKRSKLKSYFKQNLIFTVFRHF